VSTMSIIRELGFFGLYKVKKITSLMIIEWISN
jgi:hypothetical protein